MIELRATDGLFIDTAAGTIRTLRNAGLQGTPLTVWVNGTDGKGVAVPIRNGQIALENGQPVFMIHQPVIPPQLKVKTNIICTPNATGAVWSCPFSGGTVSDIVVYRNGLRQNRVAVPNQYQVDYTASPDFITLTPNSQYPWSIARMDIMPAQSPDLIVADVFYY